eukprot:1153525-Pelagomonas_calceolata.AAC.2
MQVVTASLQRPPRTKPLGCRRRVLHDQHGPGDGQHKAGGANRYLSGGPRGGPTPMPHEIEEQSMDPWGHTYVERHELHLGTNIP